MSLGRTALAVELPFNSITGIDNLESIEMRRHEYQHEICVIRAVNKRNLGLRSGDPIQVKASGALGGSETFIGYVDHTRDHFAIDADQRHTDIVCVGPTWYMQQPRQRVWKNLTISAIARHICNEYHLTIDCEDTHLVRTHNQAGESDWAFLCRLAMKYGYVVYPTQSVVHFHSRTRNINAKNVSAQRLQYVPPGKGVNTEIYSFKTLISDGPQAGKAARTMGSVDSVTGAVTSFADGGAPSTATRQSSEAAIFRQYMTSSVATSTRDMAAQVTGQRDCHMWTYQAKADTRGIANVVPTSVIYFDNFDSQWDGYWTVVSVCHKFTTDHHDEMALQLGTNSLGAPVSNFQPGRLPLTIAAIQGVPASSYTLGLPASTLPQRDGRGGPHNKAHWQGSPASLDPVPPQRTTSSRATRKLHARR